MAYTAGNVMDDAAALLNDASKSLFTYIVQLPYLRMAYRDMDQELTLNEVELNLLSEAVITVPANQNALGLPTSFFLPISLQEKAVSDTDDMYRPVYEKQDINALNLVSQNILQVWDFKHNCVNFIPSTAIRVVRLTYWRTLPTVVDDTSALDVRGGQSYLAFRTAALCSRFIGGENGKSRAIDLNGEASLALDRLISVYVKNSQGVRIRRKPFRRRPGVLR
jgi:hypothetical protein